MSAPNYRLGVPDIQPLVAQLRFCRDEILRRAARHTDDEWFWMSKSRIADFLVKRAEAEADIRPYESTVELTAEEKNRLLRTHSLLENRKRGAVVFETNDDDWAREIRRRVSNYLAARSKN